MAERPNIVFIYADDLGRGMLSCYGQKHFKTPNIDRIAGEGMRFENAYGCAYCAPARASLLTGTHDCHRGGWTITQGGLYNLVDQQKVSADHLAELIQSVSHNPAKHETFLPQLTQEVGYVTGQIGKLEWGFATTPHELRRHGWDYHYGYYDHEQCHGFYPPYLFENGQRVEISGNTRADFGIAPRIESEENREERWDRNGRAVYSQDLFDEKILSFIRTNQNQPFFLFHPTQLPHGPIIIPEIHPSVAKNPDLTEYEKEYASMILRLDETVGLILQELDKHGIAEKTAVIFCSDNGHQPYYVQPERMEFNRNLQTGETYDHVQTKFYSELSGDVFNGNDGMAGLKFSNWEGGVRLPFMVRWPGKIAAGTNSSRHIAGYDLLPTVADILGLRVPPGKDGLSYFSELTGQGDSAPERPLIIASRQGPALINPDGWKLKQAQHHGKDLYQLFNLKDDPREENDLSQAYPEMVEKLDPLLLRGCDGNYYNGRAEARQVWLPSLNFHGSDCHWDIPRN